MHITLIPRFPHAYEPWVDTSLHVAGDVIAIDGTPYDLSAVPEGGEGWPEGETPFVAPIRRIDGVIHATIVVRLGATAAPEQAGSWVIEAASGDVAIPAKRKPIEEVAE